MKEMLKLGASRPWKEAMRVMTGQPEMSTQALREYFRPLENWLRRENKKAGMSGDWGRTDVDRMCRQARNGRERSANGSKAVEVTTAVLTLLLMASMAIAH